MRVNINLENLHVQFDYNAKPRKGKVLSEADDYIVVELDEDREGKPYKSFTKSKISNLRVLV